MNNEDSTIEVNLPSPLGKIKILIIEDLPNNVIGLCSPTDIVWGYFNEVKDGSK